MHDVIRGFVNMVVQDPTWAVTTFNDSELSKMKGGESYQEISQSTVVKVLD